MEKVRAEDLKDRARQDPVGTYERAGLEVGSLRKAGTVWQAACPLHQDTKASFTVYPDGSWYCFGACRSGGSILDFYAKRLRIADFAECCERLGQALGVMAGPDPDRNRTKSESVPDRAPSSPPVTLPPVALDVIESLHQALLADERRLRWLELEKGLERWIIEEARLGVGVSPHVNWHGRRYTIPVPAMDDAESFVDVRGYGPGRDPKVLPWEKGRGTATLYPWPWVSGSAELVWCEGELDCLNLIARGIPAVTSTCGVDGALRVALPDLTGKTFWVLGDHDNAGRRLNDELPARLLAAGASRAEAVSWEEVADGRGAPGEV